MCCRKHIGLLDRTASRWHSMHYDQRMIAECSWVRHVWILLPWAALRRRCAPSLNSTCHMGRDLHCFRQSRKTGRYLAANSSLDAEMDTCCELCGLDRDLTVHHLIPKCQWRRLKRKRKVSGKDEMPVAVLCRTCHNMVHRTFSHAELARSYSSVEELKDAEPLQRYVKTRCMWTKRQNSNGYS